MTRGWRPARIFSQLSFDSTRQTRGPKEFQTHRRIRIKKSFAAWLEKRLFPSHPGAGSSGEKWCAWQDLNLHGFLHYHLKVARLPIPPHAQSGGHNEPVPPPRRKAFSHTRSLKRRTGSSRNSGGGGDCVTEGRRTTRAATALRRKPSRQEQETVEPLGLVAGQIGDRKDRTGCRMITAQRSPIGRA